MLSSAIVLVADSSACATGIVLTNEVANKSDAAVALIHFLNFTVIPSLSNQSTSFYQITLSRRYLFQKILRKSEMNYDKKVSIPSSVFVYKIKAVKQLLHDF